MSAYKQYLKPVAVLLVICLVAGAILSVLNQVTAPVIAANQEAANNATYFAVLPEADSFTALDCEVEGVSAVLKADNGAGYVITASAKGYGGDVPAAVSFDEEGNILRVIMMSNDETPGLGQRVTESSFYDQFAGLPAEELTIDGIDAVTGATISSKAAVKAVNLAIEAYQALRKEAN